MALLLLHNFTKNLTAMTRNIKVNSVCPGYCATDIKDNQGHLIAEEGAREPARLALMEQSGVTGEYRNSEGIRAW